MDEEEIKKLMAGIVYKGLVGELAQGAARVIADELAVKMSHFQRVQGVAERAATEAEALKAKLDKANADTQAELTTKRAELARLNTAIEALTRELGELQPKVKNLQDEAKRHIAAVLAEGAR
jgi:uncharacterized protein HemX